jgi:hypothetical protein
MPRRRGGKKMKKKIYPLSNPMAFKIDYYPDELIDQTKEDAVAKYNEFY